MALTAPAWVDVDVIRGHVDVDPADVYLVAAADYLEQRRPDVFATATAPATPADVPGGFQLGLALLVARLSARKGTALGVADYDGAVATIVRADPDVARLLGLAWHGAPSCG